MDNYNNETIDRENIQKSEAYIVENELRKTIQRQKKTIFRLAERNRVWKIICAVMAVIIVVESMVLWISSSDNGANVPTTTPADEILTEDIVIPESVEQVDASSGRVNELMSQMSVTDKIYQMLFVTPEALTGYENVTAAGDTTKTKLQEKKIGGLIYNSTNFESKDQTSEMMENVKSYCTVVPFVTTSEDGDDKSELAGIKSDDDYTLPDVSEILLYESSDKITEQYYNSGVSMTDFGFNTNCFGIQGAQINDVDISSLATISGCAVNGYSKSGVTTMIKAFPTKGNSDKTVDQLKSREFEIYKSVIALDVDMIVVSNGVNKNYLGEDIPYSLSNVTYDTLKKNLGFKGIIVSNAFADDNITDKYSISEIAVKSINSGCDMFICTSDIDSIVDAIKKALESGEIQQSKIDDCVTKILSLKLKRQIIE